MPLLATVTKVTTVTDVMGIPAKPFQDLELEFDGTVRRYSTFLKNEQYEKGEIVEIIDLGADGKLEQIAHFNQE